eukprot:scaffold246252_cov20-Tisochrysis_lutea.AAC.1
MDNITGSPLQGSCCICVFVRFPTPGKVKTRLAAGVGPVAACAFYRACANYTMQLACRCSSAHAAIHYSNGDKEADILDWVASLGLQVLVIGSDIPGLTESVLAAAVEALDSYEVGKKDILSLTEAALAVAVEALDSDK